MRLREPAPAQPKPPEVQPQPAPNATNNAAPVDRRLEAADGAKPAAGTPPTAAARARTPARDDLVSVNFEQVDVKVILKSIGDITGINFIPATGVAGPITVMSPTKIRLSEVYGFLQSVLDVYGYATVEMGNAVKVVPKGDAIKRNLAVHIGADPAYIAETDELITQILPLKHVDAAEVMQIIEPFLSTGAQNTICPRINSILVIDTSSNVHHIAEVLQALDVEGSEEKVVPFPLMHASAQKVSEQINNILEKTSGPASAPAPGGRSLRITSPAGKNLKVLPDDRTNTVLVVGGDQDIEMIRAIIKQLDIERPLGTDNVQVKYLSHADANEVARSLESAVAGIKLAGSIETKQTVQVYPDASTNSLIIVASPQEYEVLSKIVDKLDIVREQVNVEMLILEVSEEGLKQIGVDWATMDQAVTNGVRGFGLTNLGPRLSFQNGTLEGLAIGAWKGDATSPSIGAILQALQTTSGVNILSTPNITTSNHRKAKIVVGENRPFVTGSRITETTDPTAPTVIKQYDYKDVGITMEITPHVSQGGLITLNINSEITKLLEATASASIDTPVTAKRQAETTVTMNSDATVVIGGLTRDDTTRVEKKVPLLGDIPLVGMLFRSREEQKQKTNLLIFITPHVMASQQEWIDLSNRKKDEMPPAYDWQP